MDVRQIAPVLCLTPLLACQLLNPEFDGADSVASAGESETEEPGTSSSSTTEEPPDTEEPPNTDEPGDGDGEPGDGDGEPGDGDGEPGDGDGEPVEECYIEVLEPVADTFFQGGPNLQGICQLGWGGPYNPGNCFDLNFGKTSQHWVGVKSVNLNDEDGPSFYAFGPPEADLPPDYVPVYIEAVIYVDLLEPGSFGSVLRLERITGGENYGWYEGNLDGDIAESGSFASTYAYRIPEDAPWPNGGFHLAIDEPIVDVDLQGLQGPQPITFVFGEDLVGDIALNPGKYANGFSLTSLGLDGFDVLVNSREASAELRPYFVVEYCPI